MFNAADWTLIVLYLGAIAAIVVRTGGAGTSRTVDSYFLANRNAGWLVVGASLFASNIGAEHMVGLAGSGATRGLAVAHFEVLATVVLLLFGWFFVPYYLRSCVTTVPEYFERRYSTSVRWYLAVLSILSYVLTKISVTIAAGGIIMESLLGIDFWTGTLFVLIGTGLYTAAGGLRAVLYTDLFQAIIFILGALVVTVAGWNAMDGWEAIVQQAPPGSLSLWKPVSDPDFPWTGIVFGAPILGVWYWCADQYIVQRVLAARDVTQARRGTLFAAALKLLPLFIFVLPGLMASILTSQGKLEGGHGDNALPALLAQLLPHGLRGLVTAGLLAALMSSLSSVLNSCSTLITWDIYKKIRPTSSERRLVVIGQLVTIVLVAAGILWIPVMKQISDHMFHYLQATQAYIAPPIAATFLVGLFWKRANAQGALAALVLGLVLGLTRLVMEVANWSPPEPLAGFVNMNFLHFAAILFVICVAALITVSLCNPAPNDADLAGVTVHTTRSRRPYKSPSSAVEWTDKAITALLLAAVVTVWSLFP